MKRTYIFEKSFEKIFTKERLHYQLSQIKPQPQNISEIHNEIDKGIFFDKDPKQTFLLPKSDGSFREITLSSVKTKIIQRVLVDELSAVLHFSDHSYAFRKGKSPVKAISRVKHYLSSGLTFIAKTDIKSFFDSIDQDILIEKLKRIIKDKKIVYLIAYHLKQGFLRKQQWIDKSEGIYQGDVLSPLLSNIYLNSFDRYLEKQNIAFVRYSDDLIFLGKSKDEVSKIRSLARRYLKRLKLDFNLNKTYISTLENGFEYLGIYFKGDRLTIDRDRLSKKIESLKSDLQNKDLKKSIEIINQKVDGFLNYYGKLEIDSQGASKLQSICNEILIEKVAKAKKNREITSKNSFKEILYHCKHFIETKSRSRWADEIINRAYEILTYEKPLKSAKKSADKNKTNYIKNHIKKTELVVIQPGSYIGFSQGKIKLKQKGQIIASIPINRLTRIVILNSHTSISAFVIKECAKRKIDIDFIEQNRPFALLTYYQHIAPKLHLEQLKAYFSPKGLEIAKSIIRAKAKNQINLLKYYNRRKNNSLIDNKIEIMKGLFQKIENAKDKQTLMGIEGNISTHYWRAFGEIINKNNFTRTHKDSKDVINQALNYGYAILYNRIQSLLLHNGFNLSYPILHSIQSNKPTLSYDMIEEFRQAVVDREIISILNHKIKLSQNNGKLNKTSIKILIEHIQSRLSTPTKSRYGKTTLLNIISYQINHLKHSLLDYKPYKGFIIRL